MNRKCRQNVATDDRRTFTDKDKVHRIQTLRNDNKDAMLDCESGSHQSEDKRKLNCHMLKVLANEDTLLQTQCCSRCFLGCANWETFVADTKFSEQFRNIFCVPPQQMFLVRANGETFVSATVCPQQYVLVCQYF